MNTGSEFTKALPILAKEGEIISAIKAFPVVIISGDTGCGKSTMLGQFCLKTGRKRIAISQPRRIAAISLATHVALQMKSEVGETVGYQIRFSKQTSRRTKITYMTDGVLLRMAVVPHSTPICPTTRSSSVKA